MQALLGIIFHFLGGAASSSYYVPYKRVRGWAWESFWIVGGFFSWLIMPFVAAWLTVPNFLDIIGATDNNVIFWTYFMGVLWGIGGLTHGLGMRYLGISLGQSYILGLSSALGALVPPIFRNFFPKDGEQTFTEMLASPAGQMVIVGIVICLIGIIVCGRAGIMKERDLALASSNGATGEGAEGSVEGVKEFNLSKGLLVGTVSGVLSACFSYGLTAGKPMAAEAVAAGSHPLFQNNVIFVVILWGGITTNFIWCMFLNAKNKTFGDYTNKQTPILRNILFSALAGTTWFLQFFFYGMGETKLGNGASSWILHMAFIILISNLWGLILKEWKGVSKKTLATIFSGILIIIVSVLVVGYARALEAPVE